MSEAPEPVAAEPAPATDAAAAPQDKGTVVTAPVKEPATAPEKPKGPEGELKLKLPEGSLLKPDAVEKVAARAKELNLTPEQAQAELERESQTLSSFVEGQKAELAQTVSAWVDEAKKDQEIGGEKFAANAEVARQVVNRFGTEAFKKALNESGLGNHPELVRVFVRIGRAMKSDELVIPSAHPTEKRSPAEVLYGDTSTTKEK